MAAALLRHPAAALRKMLRMLVELARAPPGGMDPFEKMIFELPFSEPKTPDGQSLAYVQLSRALWLKHWQSDGGEAKGSTSHSIHDAVQRAHVLERQLLALIDTLK